MLLLPTDFAMSVGSWPNSTGWIYFTGQFVFQSVNKTKHYISLKPNIYLCRVLSITLIHLALYFTELLKLCISLVSRICFCLSSLRRSLKEHSMHKQLVESSLFFSCE